jgi:hypothetical protein
MKSLTNFIYVRVYVFIYFYGNLTFWILVFVHVRDPDADFRISEECDECRRNAQVGCVHRNENYTRMISTVYIKFKHKNVFIIKKISFLFRKIYSHHRNDYSNKK